MIRHTFVRSIAVAALLGTVFAVPSMAQTAAAPDAKTPPAAAAATSSKPETVEQRITALKAALKITPDQESKWSDVAKAMRDNAAKMDKLIAEKRAKPAESTSAVEDLQTYQDISQAHVDGLKHLISSFKSLYSAMTPDQKKNADVVFDKFGSANPKQQG